MKKKRKNYTKEFKEQAVAHWDNSNKAAEEVAVSLGIPGFTYLSKWKASLAKSGVDGGDRSECH